MGNNMGSPAGYYEFKEDNGTWRPCKSSAEIADALAKGMSELNLGKHKIVLDSTPMKQINLKTQKERELRFVAVQWQTSDVHEWPRTWTDLPPDESGAVEEGFKGGKRHHYTASFSYGAASPQPASPQLASPEPEAPRLSAPEAGLPRARGYLELGSQLAEEFEYVYGVHERVFLALLLVNLCVEVLGRSQLHRVGVFQGF